MFRNPRENAKLKADAQILPSSGRPPSPPTFPPPRKDPNVPAPMAAKSTPARSKSSVRPTPTKAKPAANGNILTFFKKAEELADNLFVKDRFQELGGSIKRRKTEDVGADVAAVESAAEALACTPPPPADDLCAAPDADDEDRVDTPLAQANNLDKRQRRGPFMDDSDSDDEGVILDNNLNSARSSQSIRHDEHFPKEKRAVVSHSAAFDENGNLNDPQADVSEDLGAPEVPTLKREETSYGDVGDFEGFENIEDFDEYFEEGDEFQERRYMEEQIKLEMSDGAFEGEVDDETMMQILSQSREEDEVLEGVEKSVPTCPICSIELAGVTDEQAAVHVNDCLDGKPSPLPAKPIKTEDGMESEASTPKLAPSRPPLKLRPPRPAQSNPFSLSVKKGPSSAFEKLMSGHAEDAAWKTAAASEKESRGKQAFERTCPFYKIMPGFSICVDAFRYGAVQDQKAYFLSHFHSDHYIGLTASWRHGPIYCSKVTGNLVRQQLKVDPKYVVDLNWEEETEIPGTNGVRVTMIPANHCPGSSLFLFQKTEGKGKNAKTKRVLHCGDFRACKMHVEHPLLRADVQDAISGKTRQQKIDACYLDTTYLNPRYAFPSQETVIKACADMCVSLNKASVDASDDWETMKRDRAGAGMVQFLETGKENIKTESVEPTDGDGKRKRGRLLVVVGTYSIGKERICMGIARALDCKIFASPAKTRICAALEDPELMSRLTSNPREAQVHMTPLFEIRADTLDEYLKDYRDTFTRAVAFRPSGWNYRPPNSRFVESPSVQTVLRSSNWKSVYSMRELKPQPGSTKRATCYGVPYSEHSSFRELTMFCCALRIDKVIPTVNVGSAKSRERMNLWVQRWQQDRRKNGLFKTEDFET